MKICTRCERSKDDSSFYKDRTRADGLRPACKECEKKTRCKEKQRAYYQRTRQRHIDYAKARYASNKAAGKRCANKSFKKAVDSLSDTYIRHTLIKGTALKRKDIPQELVELKRIELAIKRTVKEMTA